MGLLNSSYKNSRMKLLTTETYSSTFGPKSTRKRPAMAAQMGGLEGMMKHVKKTQDGYEEAQKGTTPADSFNVYSDNTEKIFDKGQSRRIWQELYKVVDSADVLIQVLDVRDPMGTRSKKIEDELRRPERAHKHLIIVLNKCDLVPTWVTRRWVKTLSKEFPTLAFHASVTNPFGKGALIQLLRQFGQLHKDKKQISVGFVGYPNVGKSSIINTLRAEVVCKAAPIPGETKVWQYITLFKRIFLIDCPGVVYAKNDSETAKVLKSVVRVEMVKDPSAYIHGVLERVKKEYITRTYGIEDWIDTEDFLTQFANKSGKLLKGGEPDFNNCSRMILHDWQRGKLPFFEMPPFDKDNGDSVEGPIVDQLFNKIDVKMKFSKSDKEGGEHAAVVKREAKAESKLARSGRFVDYDSKYKDVNADDETVLPEADVEELLEAAQGESAASTATNVDPDDDEEPVISMKNLRRGTKVESFVKDKKKNEQRMRRKKTVPIRKRRNCM